MNINNLFYLFLGMFIGVFYVYITHEFPKYVIQFPHPDNPGKHTFIDDIGETYKYKVKNVK
jgi:hypothetical protein